MSRWGAGFDQRSNEESLSIQLAVPGTAAVCKFGLLRDLALTAIPHSHQSGGKRTARVHVVER